MNAEALINDKNGVLVAMENGGLQRVLGDIIVSGSDPLLLVCCLPYFISVEMCYSFI